MALVSASSVMDQERFYVPAWVVPAQVAMGGDIGWYIRRTDTNIRPVEPVEEADYMDDAMAGAGGTAHPAKVQVSARIVKEQENTGRKLMR